MENSDLIITRAMWMAYTFYITDPEADLPFEYRIYTETRAAMAAMTPTQRLSEAKTYCSTARHWTPSA